VADGNDLGRELQGHLGLAHFGEQQVDDLLARAIAKQLAEGLFVERDAIGIDQFDEVVRGVAGQRREGEARVLADEAVAASLHRGIHVGEVAAAAARNADLFARIGGMIEDQHLAAALAGLDGGHHASCAGAEDDRVVVLHQRGITVFGRFGKGLVRSRRDGAIKAGCAGAMAFLQVLQLL
jgi:hypothetical protein